MKHERQPFVGGQAVEDHEKREADGIGEFGLVRRVGALDASHDRIGHVHFEGVLASGGACAQDVQADPGEHRGQPRAGIPYLVGVRPARAKPRLLHGVIGLAEGAEHSVRDRSEMIAVRLEFARQLVESVHPSHSRSAACR